MKNSSNPLAKHLATAESGAGIVATRVGTLAIVTPLTLTADAWLRANGADEASWTPEGLAVEMRYFPDLADAIIAAGFLFEREACPN